MLKLGVRCKHGLYCACYMCDYEKEIASLKEENEQLKRQSFDSTAIPSDSGIRTKG